MTPHELICQMFFLCFEENSRALEWKNISGTVSLTKCYFQLHVLLIVAMRGILSDLEHMVILVIATSKQKLGWAGNSSVCLQFLASNIVLVLFWPCLGSFCFLFCWLSFCICFASNACFVCCRRQETLAVWLCPCCCFCLRWIQLIEVCSRYRYEFVFSFGQKASQK